jgi:flagellar FliJ protein
MRQFQFALETLLRLRRHTEDRAKQEYADQQRRVEEEKTMLEQLQTARLQTEAQARQARLQEVNMILEKACDNYRRRLGEQIHQAHATLQQLEEELVRQREILLGAQRAVKVLEKLKARRYTEYLKAARRQEQIFLDEIGISHFQPIRNH